MPSNEIDWAEFLSKVETDFDWRDFIAKFPVERTEEQKKERGEIFAGFDPNGNGYLSLAEIDKGCRDNLGLYDLFEAKKPIMRAYQAAKDVGNRGGGGGSEAGADYVERNEFRLLLIYLRDYFLLWKMFDKIDAGNDGRVDKDEFLKAVPKLQILGFQVADPEEEFAKIDANSGGQVLFDEFADWALRKILVGEDASEP
jgi:Ca2+-binding EF-hand superfamily protein